MPTLAELSVPWGERLDELVGSLDVPGAVLGVSHRGERIVVPAGVRGLRDPAPVTADTAFQVGSISKLYTATLLLAIAGLEIVDRPVSGLAPEAQWMEPEITVEHLLTHSSGLAGDFFADTGRGDDALARYVTQLAELPADVPGPPGRYSYSNSGYGVLGRIIEVLTGTTYDAALRARLLHPLGAEATTTLPEETILRPAATGHNRHGDGPLTADDRWNFSRACGPLGGVAATAGDLLAFAECHLADGVAADGTALLGPGVAAAMRARRLETPRFARPSARGLGFGIFDWPAGSLIGHDGETYGEIAKLRLVPEHDLALVVLTNAVPDGNLVARGLERAVLAEWGYEPPVLPPVLSEPGFDPAPYVGRYRNFEGLAEITADGDGLRAVWTATAEGLDPEPEVTRLAPIGDDAFVDAGEQRPTDACRFGDPDKNGRFGSLFSGRLLSRVDES